MNASFVWNVNTEKLDNGQLSLSLRTQATDVNSQAFIKPTIKNDKSTVIALYMFVCIKAYLDRMPNKFNQSGNQIPRAHVQITVKI